MDYKASCPYCGSRNTKKLSVIHDAGLSTRKGRRKGWGFSFGSCCWRYSIASWKDSHTYQSKLSKDAAPPEGLVGLGFLVLLVLGALMFQAVFIPALIFVLALIHDYYERRSYDKTWECLRCGDRFEIDLSSQPAPMKQLPKPVQTQNAPTSPGSPTDGDKTHQPKTPSGGIAQQAYEAASYLERAGFSEDHLTRIHHKSQSGGRETYRAFYAYWNSATNVRDRNQSFARRLILIMEKHREGVRDFNRLCEEALARYPIS